jgi:hypothetical protein
MAVAVHAIATHFRLAKWFAIIGHEYLGRSPAGLLGVPTWPIAGVIFFSAAGLRCLKITVY